MKGIHGEDPARQLMVAPVARAVVSAHVTRCALPFKILRSGTEEDHMARAQGYGWCFVCQRRLVRDGAGPTECLLDKAGMATH
jgi:hypothetical protein